MSIVMNMFWSGVTAADYDRLGAEVRWRESPAPGGRYHLAWFTDEGIRVVDVWDGAEAFDDFTTQRLMPGVRAIGLQGEPRIDIWPLYDLQIEGDPPRGAVIADGIDPGMPKDPYVALERSMDWKTNPPAGAFVHIAALDGETIRDVGVWDAAATVEAFSTGPFAEALAGLGIDAGDVADEPVHDLYAWFDPTRVRTAH